MAGDDHTSVITWTEASAYRIARFGVSAVPEMAVLAAEQAAGHVTLFQSPLVQLRCLKHPYDCL
jgi:hypothetical protein